MLQFKVQTRRQKEKFELLNFFELNYKLLPVWKPNFNNENKT